MGTATVYVVNWAPRGVGGFEWRWNRANAERFARELGDATARVHAVELPSGLTEPSAITDWLDSEGWSDGGDPR